MENIIGIYSITNKINNFRYIGQSNNIKRRWHRHKTELNNNSHPNKYLQRAFNKYGVDNFEFEILEECNSRDELNKKETYWCNFYKPNVYNLGNTGEVGTCSEETKKLMSLHNRLKGKKRSQEECKKISMALKGRKLSEEHKRRLSEDRKGKHFNASYEFKKGHIPSPKCNIWTNERRKKLSNALKGKHNSIATEFKNINCSGSNNPRAYGVYQYTKDMKLVAYYETALEASQKTGVNRGLICNCRCGTRKSAGGYIWKAKKENEND